MKLHDDYYEEERSSGSNKMTYIYMLLIMSVEIGRAHV